MFSDSVNYAKGETPMTDYQFKRFEELRNKCEVLERENEALYNLLQTAVKEGKSPEEILATVTTLRNKVL